MFKHFLQSDEWQKYEKLEGHQTFTEETADFSYLAIKHNTKLGSYLFVPYGPSLKTGDAKNNDLKNTEMDITTAEKSLQKALESLKKLAKRERCFFIRLEPTVPLEAKIMTNYACVKSTDIDPAHTWLLDLSPTEPELHKNFTQGTRTCVNQFPKKGLTVEVSHDPADIRYLTSLQHKLAKQKNITAYSETHLKNELSQPFASLYLVRYNPDTDQTLKNPDPSAPMSSKPRPKKNSIIAASLFFDDLKNSTRFYMQSAADMNYKYLPATHGMLAAAIFDAKQKGQKFFDFWGIAPDNAPQSHPWAGFTKFKKSFGGFAKNYAGTYDLPLNKTKYTLYKKIRTINRRLRKIK